MSEKGYYRWCGTDGGHWLNGHVYYYDGSRMKTESGNVVRSHANTVGLGGSWVYVEEAQTVPQKKPIVYVCEVCADDPCYLVIMKDPPRPPDDCPFRISGVKWRRRTDG